MQRHEHFYMMHNTRK